MLELISDIRRYVYQMLPLGLVALVALVCILPHRKKRLAAKGLVSSKQREAALALFTFFCAGLAALTLFPANIWSYISDWLFHHQIWEMIWSGRSLLSFYPAPPEIWARMEHLPDVLVPFQEIRRALRSMDYWLLFMMLGNVAMFVPLGFFPALLWRRWRWWKSFALGMFTSCLIEFIQFFIDRSTDIDDVILNTTGALAGFWLYWILSRIFPKFISSFHCFPKRGDVPHGLFRGN